MLKKFVKKQQYKYVSRNRRIQDVLIYATNRCNSKCNHCHIWKQQPKIDLSLSIFEGILDARVTNGMLYKTRYGLEGGEFLLHPKYKKILELFNNNSKEYFVISNCILADKLIRTVKEFDIQEVCVSMDGDRDGYKKVRCIDNWENVDRVVQELKGNVNLSIFFAATPWNTQKDYGFVKEYARRNGLVLGVSIYQPFRLFDVKEKPISFDFTKEESPYLRHYHEWFNGKFSIPCISPTMRITVNPNGDIPLCCKKDIILGNLYANSLDYIWNSEITKKLHREIRGCNSCWMSCHRAMDIFFRDAIA